jgi:hypothetical protein
LDAIVNKVAGEVIAECTGQEMPINKFITRIQIRAQQDKVDKKFMVPMLQRVKSEEWRGLAAGKWPVSFLVGDDGKVANVMVAEAA